MSEPSELSADAKSLVEQGRVGDVPSASDKQRIKGRLAAELGVGAFVVAALPSTLPGTLPSSVLRSRAEGPCASTTASGPALAAPGAAARGLWGHGLLKLAAAASALGALGALYVGAISWTSTQAPAHAYAPVVVPPPQVPASEERAVPAELVTAPEASPQEPFAAARTLGPNEPRPTRARTAKLPASAARHAPGATSDAKGAPSSSTLGAELALLATAQRALRDRLPAQALLVVEQHARRFATGSLGEERRGIEALAHCQLGEPQHVSVAAFLAEAPSSPLAARVQRECGSR